MRRAAVLLFVLGLVRAEVLINGMRLFIFPQSRMELVRISAFITCGRADEKTPGSASLLFYYFKSKNYEQLQRSPIKTQLRLGLDYMVLQTTGPTTYWAIMMNFIKKFLTDRKIDIAHLAMAKRLMLMEVSHIDFTEFAPYLFYPDTLYATPFPDETDINRLSKQDLRDFRRRCIVPPNVILIYEGSLIREVFYEKYVKELASWAAARTYVPPPPPDVPPIPFGFVSHSGSASLIWFFKIIDPSDLFPIRALITLEGISPGGILFNELREKRSIASNVSFGIKYNRKVSFAYIKIDTTDHFLPAVYKISRDLIFRKMKEGIKRNELKRLQRYLKGVESIEKSLPWRKTREVIDSVLMKPLTLYSLERINSSLSNLSYRSISVLFIGREGAFRDIVRVTGSLAILDRHGRSLYTIKK